MSAALQRRKGTCTDGGAATDHRPLTPSSPGVQPPTVTSPLNTRQLRRRRRRGKYGSRLLLLALGGCLCLGFFVYRLLLPPRTVRLPVAGVDIEAPSATELPLIHIVNTRFMQEQSPLMTLGMARLHLFRTFCFPTMIGQSTQNFLWIIKTDPQFAVADNPVFQELLEMVRPYSNIYIVASNRNFLISPDLHGSWRDGAEGLDLLQSRIFSGNVTRLHQAIALREERPVLETRLDADDGLHMLYLQYLQYVALKRFIHPDNGSSSSTNEEDSNHGRQSSARPPLPPTKWLYWCTRRHIEWRSSSEEGQSSSVGALNPVEHSKLCITPGITVGYNVGVQANEVPVESHDLLYKHLANSTACLLTPTYHQTDKPACLDLVEELTISAIRSRTWTSAGMQDVETPHGFSLSKSKARAMNEKLWKLLEERFHMNRTLAQTTQRYMQQNKAQIAYENLLGQCTSHHSCKQQAKDELQKYVDEAQKKSGGTAVQIVHQPIRNGGGLRVPWRPVLPDVAEEQT